jgi:hypothetical protein
MILAKFKDNTFATLPEVGAYTLDDVRGITFPILPTTRSVSAVAATFIENGSAAYVQTSDGVIHLVSHFQYHQMGLQDLNLPEIDTSA